ncbi:SNAP receptor [Martiniozyma asiatica (nom. inval.)]|nr:SNAP receptor [Martiniozyma asiatica]
MSSAQAYDPYNPFADDAAAELNQKDQSKSNNNMAQLQQTLDETTGVMRDNIRQMNERGEMLQDIDSRADELQNNATLFNKTANQVRKDMWKKNLKLKLCVAIIILVIIIVVAVPIAIHFSN